MAMASLAVELSPFFITKYELRQAVWKRVMGSNPSEFRDKAFLPVDWVSWENCNKFCRELGLCFPSEAQWEYACRAGSSKPFAGKLKDMGWYSENSREEFYPVGQKKPNAFGLYDMHGNVLEWCKDLYDEDFYKKSEAGGPDNGIPSR